MMAEYGFIGAIHNGDDPDCEHLLAEYYLSCFRERHPDAEVVDSGLKVGPDNSGRLPNTRAVGFLIEYTQ